MTPNELNEIKAKLLKHDRLPRPDAIRIIGKLVNYIEKLESQIKFWDVDRLIMDTLRKEIEKLRYENERLRYELEKNAMQSERINVKADTEKPREGLARVKCWGCGELREWIMLDDIRVVACEKCCPTTNIVFGDLENR